VGDVGGDAQGRLRFPGCTSLPLPRAMPWQPGLACYTVMAMAKARRTFLRAAAAGLAGAGASAAAGAATPAATQAASQPSAPSKKVHYRGQKPSGTPLFSGAVSYGNLLFIAGKGAHFEGDIKAHTKHVLDEVEKELVNAGSSMEKVLKCNVYLNDLKDYAAMNETFRGRFGSEPPVRTTIAAAGGIPGNSLVEIDVIAYI
jgi:2-iminobutanoate/2-iminopropanoate deaminase